MTHQQFETVIVPLMSYIRKIALSFTGDRHSAEDMVQDTLIRLMAVEWTGGNPKALIAQIMRWINTDRQRLWHARGREHMRIDDVDTSMFIAPAYNATPETLPEILERLEYWVEDEVRAAIIGLPRWCRDPFLLRVVGGIDVTEVAAVYGIKNHNVVSRVNQAKIRLRAALG